MRDKTNIRKGLDNDSRSDKMRRRINLSCSICPPNRGENRKHHKKHGTRKPKKK